MFEELKKEVSGELLTDDETLNKYSHDASLFEVRPQGVLHPKGSEDVKKAVHFISQNKKNNPEFSITARSAGTCMAGGSINESLILDFTTHMNGVLGFDDNVVTVLPGTFYRDFEKETLSREMILPCFTASKNLCALGGMIGNNCAGEKTLRYGKMERYIESLKVVFSDGNEYEVKPLSKEELENKISQNNFEGSIYKGVWDLIQKNKEEIEEARPNVSKNSAGYYLWNVVTPQERGGDPATVSEGGIGNNYFDLTKLIVGSQGTLGIVTEARLRLVKVKNKSKLFVIFLRDLTHLSDLVNEILPFDPESIESYDDETLKLAVRFFPEMLKTMKSGFLKLMWSFLPEAGMMLTGGIPKLILLVEFVEDSEEEIDEKLLKLEERIKHFKLKTHTAHPKEEAEKYWTIRRESFNLLRKHVKGKRTAPFVDDVIVRPEHLPAFLPKMREILDEYGLLYTIAGHAGNGNFHIIPLMDMKDTSNVQKIVEVSDKIYDLVAKYDGSITAEHNDGIVRTPYLHKMFSLKMLELFKDVKNIFDPENILNPGKKVGGSVEYMKNHIAIE